MLHGGAAPVPLAEVGFEGAVAVVGVEVAGAGPAESGGLEVDLDAAEGRDGGPAVAAGGVEGEACAGEGGGVDADGPADGEGQGGAAFGQGDGEGGAVPYGVAGTDFEAGGVAGQGCAAVFGHGPAFGAAVEGCVHADVVFGVGGAVVAGVGGAAGPGVPGGEDAADEGDDGEAVGSVVAQRVDVPPGVAALRNRRVKTGSGLGARSSITSAAARRPESVAMGTPAPGWVLPPAR